MPVVMFMRWEGTTEEGYQALRKEVNIDGDPPRGGLLHIVAIDDKGARITDVWESPELFNEFVETRLMPAVARLGITTQPQVELYPAVTVFTPGYTKRV
jgi:hypothetical protein